MQNDVHALVVVVITSYQSTEHVLRVLKSFSLAVIPGHPGRGQDLLRGLFSVPGCKFDPHCYFGKEDGREVLTENEGVVRVDHSSLR